MEKLSYVCTSSEKTTFLTSRCKDNPSIEAKGVLGPHECRKQLCYKKKQNLLLGAFSKCQKTAGVQSFMDDNFSDFGTHNVSFFVMQKGLSKKEKNY